MPFYRPGSSWSFLRIFTPNPQQPPNAATSAASQPNSMRRLRIPLRTRRERRSAPDSIGIQRPKFSPFCMFTKRQFSTYIKYLRDRKRDFDIQNPPFPNAMELNDFLLYCLSPGDEEKLKAAKVPLPLSPCSERHPRHPNDVHDELSKTWCPLCFLEMHKQFVRVVTRAWKHTRVGYGPQLKSAWHFARAEMANYCELLGVMANEERQWEEQHPEWKAEDAEEVYSYRRALRKFEMDLEAVDPLAQDKAQGSSCKVEKKRSNKRVSFDPGVQDYTRETARAPSSFRRENKHFYKPGRYACPSKQGWVDTSFMSNWKTTLCQCKLFLKDSTADMESKDAKDMSGCSGLLENYRYRDEVLEEVELGIKRAKPKEKIEKVKQIESSDAIMALKPVMTQLRTYLEAFFTDVRPFVLEKEDQEERVPKQEGKKADSVDATGKSPPKEQEAAGNLPGIESSDDPGDHDDSSSDISDVDSDEMDIEYVQSHGDSDMPSGLPEALDDYEYETEDDS